MSVMKRPAGDRLVRSPMEPLRTGRSAEAFERHVQQSLRSDWLDPRISLEDLSGQLMDPASGVESVTWENAKREKA